MKHTYRFTRRYGPYAAGEERDLSEVEAIRLENESPGLLVRVEQRQGTGVKMEKPEPPKDDKGKQ